MQFRDATWLKHSVCRSLTCLHSLPDLNYARGWLRLQILTQKLYIWALPPTIRYVMFLGKCGVEPEYRAVTASQKTQERAFAVAVTAAIFSGTSKCGWNVWSRREEFPDGKRSRQMRVEGRSGEQLPTRSPMRCFGTWAKLSFISVGGTLRFFYVQENGGTVRCAT